MEKLINELKQYFENIVLNTKNENDLKLKMIHALSKDALTLIEKESNKELHHGKEEKEN